MRKGGKSKTPTIVTFDSKDRQEFLASFENRKKRLRRRAELRKKEQEQQAKREKRKKRRDRVAEIVKELRKDERKEDNTGPIHDDSTLGSNKVLEEKTFELGNKVNERAKVTIETISFD